MVEKCSTLGKSFVRLRPFQLNDATNALEDLYYKPSQIPNDDSILSASRIY